MNAAKRVVNITVILLTIVSVVMTCAWVYISVWGKFLIPQSINSTYATSVTDPLTNEKLPTLQASYYNNKNGSGCEVIEFRINAYSGISRQALYPRGFQMVWKDGKIVQYTDPTTGEKSNVWFYDYDSTSDNSFLTGHVYKPGEYDKNSNVVVGGDVFIVDVDDKPVGLKLDGTYKYNTTLNWGESLKQRWSQFWSGDISGKKYTGVYNTAIATYTFEDLLLKIRDIIKSCSHGTGNYPINLIDLGDFLHIYELDNNGNCKGSPIGYGGQINSFFSMEAHYDNRGMMWTKQSLFGSVAGDFEYNLTGIDESVKYWQAISVYNIDESMFETRYSQADNGFYYVLPASKINELNDFEKMEINITFNVSNLTDVNVLGFDYYALQGLKINSLTIKSKTQRDFRLLFGSLRDTGLTRENIYLENINLINISSGVEL